MTKETESGEAAEAVETPVDGNEGDETPPVAAVPADSEESPVSSEDESGTGSEDKPTSILSEVMDGSSESGEATPFDPETFTYPEGINLTDDDKGTIAGIAKDFSVPSEAIAGLLEHAKKVADAESDQIGSAWEATVEGWRTESLEAYGGEEKLASTAGAVIAPLLNTYGDEDLRTALAETGMGNRLCMLRFLVKLGNAFGEGEPLNADGGQSEEGGQDDPLVRLYPNMPEYLRGSR